VDPKNLAGVIASVRQIGALLGAKDQARALGADMQHRIDRVKALVAQTEYRPRVFFQIGIAPIISAGDRTFINELITLAGGINLAAGSVPYPRFSREKVLALKPEVIIITSMARGQAFERVKAQWAGWPNLPAAVQGRIYIVDSNTLDRPTPRLVDGLELLCRLIHPELGSPR
jgi:iron complex transport system substrate-binding protein